ARDRQRNRRRHRKPRANRVLRAMNCPTAAWHRRQAGLPWGVVFGLLGPMFSETTTMVPFFVQFKCKLGQSYAVANALAEAEIASEIYSTAGDYNRLVKFYVDNDTDIGHFVNEKVQVIPGIQDTHTIITFKAFGTSSRGCRSITAVRSRHST